MTNQTRENLTKTFITGLPGILKISEFGKTLFKETASMLSILASLLIVLTAYITEVDTYKLIIELKNSIITFLPGILGFTIAGYTLVVGFIQSNMLEKISDKMENSDYSLYQKMSSIFGLNIIIQGFALIIAYIVHLIIYFDTNGNLKLLKSECFVSIINWIGLLFISLAFCFGIIIVIQIVLNIFNFSQLHHYFINKAKIEEQEQSDKEEKK